MTAAEPRAGTRFELRVLADLRANGYWGMRSPASKSPIDVVAIKPGQVLFVQAKLNGRLDPEGWNALMDACDAAGALPVLAARPRPGRIAYHRLLARKDGTGRRQPMEPFEIDIPEGDTGHA